MKDENMHHDHNNMHNDHSNMDHTSHSNHNHDGSSNDHSGHEGMDHSMHGDSFKKKFWISLALAIPIMILSPMMGLRLPFQITFKGSEWIVLVLATILYLYGGEPFFAGAKTELKNKSPGMMMLITMGISVSYFYSIYAFIADKFFQADVMDFFWELASLIVIMLLGHWIEMNAVSNAGNALKKLAELLPDEVVRINIDGIEEVISLQDVQNGEKLIVKAGDKVPTDGIIISGQTIIDESAITGESKGVLKKKDDQVIGGSVNGDGTITIQVTGTGESGYISQVMDMVRQAQSDKSKIEALSDKVAKWLFYIALVVGITAFIVWLIVGNLPIALERMVTVFIIACPHALGLAIPLVVARSTSIAAQNGLLLKNRSALENSYDIDMVMLDKTGTLTQGNFSVTGIESLSNKHDTDELLRFIGALESTANHPIADGIMKFINSSDIDYYEALDAQNITGVGIQASINNHTVKIVNGKELKNLNIHFDDSQITKYSEQGNTISYLIIDDELVGFIALGDVVKPEAKTFINHLKEMDIEPVMLTGDNVDAAKAVANYLGITQYYGGLLPEDKEKIVKDLMEKGNRVAMVGDGINDAPSLARATVGIAIGAGTDIAIDSADVILTNSNPEDIVHFLNLAKETRKKMIQNLWWGAGYNVIAIPLAAGILAPIGFILSPAVGAVLMSLSTIIVALNAMTLKIKK